METQFESDTYFLFQLDIFQNFINNRKINLPLNIQYESNLISSHRFKFPKYKFNEIFILFV